METKPNGDDQAVDPRTYFAAERTLLAWIRTGLAMMGFGFVVARFGLFLREIASVQAVPLHQRLGVSLWVGTALVVLGVMVNICAVLKHRQTVLRLSAGQPLIVHPMSLGSYVSLILAALGLAVAFYLIFGLAAAT